MRPLLCALAGLALLRAAAPLVDALHAIGTALGSSKASSRAGVPFINTAVLPSGPGRTAPSPSEREAKSVLTAEPFMPSHGDPAWNTGCDRHMAIHGRLDVIEETVEKTVEHLEAEVKGLLGQLEELAWNLPPGSFSPTTPDLLGDDGFGAPEPELPGNWK